MMRSSSGRLSARRSISAASSSKRASETVAPAPAWARGLKRPRPPPHRHPLPAHHAHPPRQLARRPARHPLVAMVATEGRGGAARQRPGGGLSRRRRAAGGRGMAALYDLAHASRLSLPAHIERPPTPPTDRGGTPRPEGLPLWDPPMASGGHGPRAQAGDHGADGCGVASRSNAKRTRGLATEQRRIRALLPPQEASEFAAWDPAPLQREVAGFRARPAPACRPGEPRAWGILELARAGARSSAR